MKHQTIVIIIVLLLLCGGIFSYSRGKLTPETVVRAPAQARQAHFYKNSNVSIRDIVLKIVYVVPKSFRGKTVADFASALQPHLDEIVKFHGLQMRGLSGVRYEIFAAPVILEHENGFYDTANTDRGNPEGLLNISAEVYRRVFSPGGDLYDERFAAKDSGEYPVLGLIYEGVGTSGSAIYESELDSAGEIAKQLGIPVSGVRIVGLNNIEGFFILNREFLTREEYVYAGDSILYHEFAHTFGLADSYNEETNQPIFMDIMGGGRNDPLKIAYIEKATLRDLGIVGN